MLTDEKLRSRYAESHGFVGLTDDWKIRFEVYFLHDLSSLKRRLILS